MNIRKTLVTSIALASLSLGSLQAKDVSVSIDDNAVILAGYDAVSYFTKNTAVKGSKKYTSVHNNSIYQFSSAKNRDLFNKAPDKYAPQYGGYCAYGAALGKKFEVDGESFEIVDNKLYVNKDPEVYKLWDKEEAKNIKAANKAWPKIKDKKPSSL